MDWKTFFKRPKRSRKGPSPFGRALSFVVQNAKADLSIAMMLALGVTAYLVATAALLFLFVVVNQSFHYITVLNALVGGFFVSGVVTAPVMVIAFPRMWSPRYTVYPWGLEQDWIPFYQAVQEPPEFRWLLGDGNRPAIVREPSGDQYLPFDPWMDRLPEIPGSAVWRALNKTDIREQAKSPQFPWPKVQAMGMVAVIGLGMFFGYIIVAG